MALVSWYVTVIPSIVVDFTPVAIAVRSAVAFSVFVATQPRPKQRAYRLAR